MLICLLGSFGYGWVGFLIVSYGIVLVGVWWCMRLSGSCVVKLLVVCVLSILLVGSGVLLSSVVNGMVWNVIGWLYVMLCGMWMLVVFVWVSSVWWVMVWVVLLVLSLSVDWVDVCCLSR